MALGNGKRMTSLGSHVFNWHLQHSENDLTGEASEAPGKSNPVVLCSAVQYIGVLHCPSFIVHLIIPYLVSFEFSFSYYSDLRSFLAHSNHYNSSRSNSSGNSSMGSSLDFGSGVGLGPLLNWASSSKIAACSAGLGAPGLGSSCWTVAVGFS
jgi:hypothetical protein